MLIYIHRLRLPVSAWRNVGSAPLSTSCTLGTSFREGVEELEEHFQPKMPIEEVKNELCKQEFYQATRFHPIVKSFSANQIGVNRPVEDRWNAGQFGGFDYTAGLVPPLPSLSHSGNPEEGSFLDDPTSHSGLLFNVTDGHAGPACAHAMNWRYLDYLSASLLSPRQLELIHDWWRRHHCSSTDDYYGTPLFSQELHLCRSVPMHLGYKPWGDMDAGLKLTHAKHIRQFVNELLSSENEDVGQSMHIQNAMISALCRMELDAFMSAMPTSTQTLSKPHLRAVTSGCVSSVAYISHGPKSQLYVAQVGDTGAVLGSVEDTPNGTKRWSAELLVAPHNADHPAEVERILKEHPLNEADTIFREGRLLGQLIPLRAFGDVRFKWKAPDLKFVSSVLGMPPNYPITPSYYYTPPYLTCQPEIRRVTLDPGRHNFLIIASDGLWDTMTPLEAVEVVSEWLAQHPQDSSQVPPEKGDTPSTALIRAALGGKSGDLRRISIMLSMPASIARYYRDDITALVVLFR